jgi:hypothetical protein
MIDPEQVPPVDDSELLARYVMQSGHFRKSDRTVKPELFMPHPYQDLSVTRHRDATLTELRALGVHIAEERKRTLYGRADIRTIDCHIGKVKVVEDPLPENSNHADIRGFPSEKADQKAIALKLVEAASKIIPFP